MINHTKTFLVRYNFSRDLLTFAVAKWLILDFLYLLFLRKRSSLRSSAVLKLARNFLGSNLQVAFVIGQMGSCFGICEVTLVESTKKMS